MLGSCFGQRLVAVNEWVMVRREERAIYTHSRNLTVQIYVRSSDVDLWTFDLYRKQCSQQGQSHYEQVNVGTPIVHWDFRWLGLPTYVGSSDECGQ